MGKSYPATTKLVPELSEVSNAVNYIDLMKFVLYFVNHTWPYDVKMHQQIQHGGEMKLKVEYW